LSETDVIVLGGGPAGAAAAIVSAEAGLGVKVIQRSRPASAHAYDAVHPGLFPLLDRLGVADEIARAGFIRHAGHWVESESSRHFIAFGNDHAGPWLGAQLYRPLFDRILFDRARSLGAEVCEAGIEDTLTCDNQVCGIQTRDEKLSSKYVLDATGRWRWLVRRLRLPTVLASPAMYARYGIVNADNLTLDEAPALAMESRGWTWTARVTQHSYLRIRLASSDHSISEAGSRVDSRDLRLLGLLHGSDVTWSLTGSPAGPGYFVIGDAAVILDPASSHGILRAIMSGMMAAHLIVQTVRGRLDPQLGARWYERWMRDWFEHDASTLRRLYRGPGQPPNWLIAQTAQQDCR
jgi:flavin-dependent dehydrogenase